MAAATDKLARGKPKGDVLGYVKQTLSDLNTEEHPIEKMIIPRVNSFALVGVAKEAGIPLDRIVCSDIDLYSCIIGRLLDPSSGSSPFTLSPRAGYEWLYPYMTDPVGMVAAVVLGLRISQLKRRQDSLYVRERIREFSDRADIYIQQIRKDVVKLEANLAGVKFTASGSGDFIRAHAEVTDRSVVLFKPPTKTETLKVAEEVFDWDKPSFDESEEYDVEGLAQLCANGPRTVLLVSTADRTTSNPVAKFGGPWEVAYVSKPPMGRLNITKVEWILQNRPLGDAALHRRDVETSIPGKYKLFTEGEITPDSELRLVPETKEVVSYYRDLLVHRLGMIEAERYKILLIDGQLLACVGIHLQNLRAGGVSAGIAKLVFCFTPENPRYTRMNKLALMCMVSDWAWQDELSDIEPPPRAVQTTALTKFYESKVNRGIFTLHERIWMPELKENKLVYYSDINIRTPQETLRLWLTKWGDK